MEAGREASERRATGACDGVKCEKEKGQAAGLGEVQRESRLVLDVFQTILGYYRRQYLKYTLLVKFIKSERLSRQHMR